jgi:hypothetical protein
MLICFFFSREDWNFGNLSHHGDIRWQPEGAGWPQESELGASKSGEDDEKVGNKSDYDGEDEQRIWCARQNETSGWAPGCLSSLERAREATEEEGGLSWVGMEGPWKTHKKGKHKDSPYLKIIDSKSIHILHYFSNKFIKFLLNSNLNT